MKYKRIRSLARGIEVLRYLNMMQGAYPVDIGKALGLPRPTAHRILEALEELDLVYRGPNSREFRLTPSVRRLASGGSEFSTLRTIAWPVMRDLTAEVVWPCGLAVLNENAMLVVDSTCRQSSMSSGIEMAGQSHALLSSALGQALLSHCGREQRDAIIAELRRHLARNDLAIDDLKDLNAMAQAGHCDGYSICLDLVQPRWASIAVPLRFDGAAIASMNILWHVADLNFDEAIQKLSGPLRSARDRIEAQLCGSMRDRLPSHAAETRLSGPKAAHTKRETLFNIQPPSQSLTVAAL